MQWAVGSRQDSFTSEGILPIPFCPLLTVYSPLFLWETD